MSSDSIIYLCINLPQAVERRRDVADQAARLGLDVHFVPAISGKELPPHVPDYDRAERRKSYHYDLTPNEIACALSHKKALRAFLDSSAEYAVIMEDDVHLSPNIKEGLHELTHHVHGWEAAKLYIAEDDKLTRLGGETPAGVGVRTVFPRKILWAAIAWCYTRTAAQKLLAGMRTFHLAADQQIGNILLQQGIPTIGITPNLITTYNPNSENSYIGPRGEAHAGGKRSLLQYLRYRLSVMSISRAKKRMIRLMQQRLRRVEAH